MAKKQGPKSAIARQREGLQTRPSDQNSYLQGLETERDAMATRLKAAKAAKSEDLVVTLTGRAKSIADEIKRVRGDLPETADKG